jgi:hypothetical protein
MMNSSKAAAPKDSACRPSKRAYPYTEPRTPDAPSASILLPVQSEASKRTSPFSNHPFRKKRRRSRVGSGDFYGHRVQKHAKSIGRLAARHVKELLRATIAEGKCFTFSYMVSIPAGLNPHSVCNYLNPLERVCILVKTESGYPPASFILRVHPLLRLRQDGLRWGNTSPNTSHGWTLIDCSESTGVRLRLRLLSQVITRAAGHIEWAQFLRLAGQDFFPALREPSSAVVSSNRITSINRSLRNPAAPNARWRWGQDLYRNRPEFRIPEKRMVDGLGVASVIRFLIAIWLSIGFFQPSNR